VFGIPVASLSMEETLSFCDEMLAGQRPPGIVCTADTSGVVIAQQDEELKAIYNASALNTPDSQGVVWAMKRRGYPDRGRVSGVDLMDRLMALSAEKGYRVFLLGSSPGVAELAAERLRLRHPGCNIVGTRHGYFTPDDDELIAREIAEAKPDLVFAAMGIPRQEKFLHRALATTGAKLGIGVGGSIDVFSGKVKRAPKLIQRMRIEWLWRTLTNPKKIKKAACLPKFVNMELRRKR
jgi:N-acetylglucosaminyldiphosphoundecaprenol N-acetyl-beta-D-mannosaminyltransferase